MLFDRNKNIRNRIKGNLIFYDVDTQNDFILKSGALPVPGAEKLTGNLEKLTNYARSKPNCLITGSVDRHFPKDEELERNGGPFPDHCMDNTWGQQKIPVTNPVSPTYIPNKRTKYHILEQLIGDKREFFFEKQHYDVFTNPNVDKLLDEAGFAVVYGVATDYCVKAAVLGLRELCVETFVVEDAIAGITVEGCLEAIKDMKEAGAKFITTQKVLEGKIDAYISACYGDFS